MNTEKLDLLREALPYIQKFKGKTFVVKFSGKVTEVKENLASLAEELALIHQVGIKVCVIHGGGKQLSELASKLGVTQTVIDGRRVTSRLTACVPRKTSVATSQASRPNGTCSTRPRQNAASCQTLHAEP